MATRPRNAFPLQTEDSTCVRSLRHRQRDSSGRCRYSDARPKYGLCQGDRQVEVNIVPLSRKETMWINRNLHQRVAWRAFTERQGALSAKPQNLPRFNSRRNCYVERSTVR